MKTCKEEVWVRQRHVHGGLVSVHGNEHRRAHFSSSYSTTRALHAVSISKHTPSGDGYSGGLNV